MVLYQALTRHDPIRLIGVRAEQLALGGASTLWSTDETWAEAEGVMDEASTRFGRGAVIPASLLGHGGRRSIERQLRDELNSSDSGVD